MNALPRITSATRSLRSTRRYASAATTPARIYTDRKAILYQSYTHILDHTPAILLFQPNNLTSAELAAIRRAIAEISSSTSQASSPIGNDSTAATLLTVRTGILSAVINARNDHSRAQSTALQSLLSGPLALVTLPQFSPAHITKVLTAINKALNLRPAPATRAGTALPVNARMMLLGGIFDGQHIASAPEIVQHVSRLPELDTLRAQLVGLLGAAPAQLVGALQSAGGGGLVRTLKGLENNLKGDEVTDRA
ncbi:hypothetical protein NliqN6_1078 [Naganishia liquefaciens]|uniref:50S ribosomal protein L10 n=1 Tax=Naganishia liquefaciens TaxID=104408 RepID=A0A8H3TNZ5_9TREE|nr:hypothetical protein NliqN6_1078 [Naganishia liquefaciens]